MREVLHEESAHILIHVSTLKRRASVETFQNLCTRSQAGGLSEIEYMKLPLWEVRTLKKSTLVQASRTLIKSVHPRTGDQ
jgi:hypothetical protein